MKWSDQPFPRLLGVNIELTNHCDMRCSFCMNPRADFRPKGNISEYLIDKMVNELDKGTIIIMAGIGEASLHPDFLKILHKLTGKFEQVRIVTNGSLFRSEKLIRGVLDFGLKKINLSLDYIDEAMYREIKGAELGKVISNLKDFVRIRRRHKNKPLLQINYLYEKGKDDYITAIEFLKGFMEEPWEIYIRKIKNLANQVDIDEEMDEEFLDKHFAGLQNDKVKLENWNRFLSDTNFRKDNPGECRHINEYYALLSNGDVLPCCIDYNAKMVLCNAKDHNMTDLFYGKEFEEIRNKREQNEVQLCKSCNDYFKSNFTGMVARRNEQV